MRTSLFSRVRKYLSARKLSPVEPGVLEPLEPRVMLSVDPAGEFRINSYTYGSQQDPAVDADAAGNYVVVWEGENADGLGGYEIYFQRYDRCGRVLGAEQRANLDWQGNQYDPAVAVADDGRFVVTWQLDPSSGYDSVWGRLFAADGTPLSGDFRVNTDTSNNKYHPSVAMDADGDFIIAWDSYQDGSYYGIYAQRYASDGTPAGSEFRVNTYTSSYQQYPSVAIDDDGDFVITWQSYGQDGSAYGIYAQRYASDGTAAGSEFRVNTYTSSDQSYPSVAMDTAGDFVIAWQSTGQDGSGYGIYAQRYAADGTVAGAEFRVNSYGPNDQRQPSVAMEPDGDFLIAWYGYGSSGESYDVQAQLYAADGTAVGGEFRANTYISGSQYYPSVAAGADGEFLVAWYDGNSSRYDVYGRLLGGDAEEPDLVAVGIDAPQGANLGQTIALTGRVRNHGAACGGASVQFYLSEDAEITAEDTPIGSPIAISGFDAYETYAISESFAVPDVAAGDWYVGLLVDIADQVAEADEGNNAWSTAEAGQTVNLAEPPPGGGEVPVVTGGYGGQGECAIAFGGLGEHVVVWSGYNAQSNYDVYLQRYDRFDRPIGAPLRVNDDPQGDQKAPSVAMDDSGALIVVWQSDTDQTDIRARLFAADFSPLTEEFRVNTYAFDDQIDPSVAMAPDGRFAIAWASQNQDGSGYGIYAQRYAADGTAVGTEFRANTYTSSDQSYPSVAMDAFGEFVIAWQSNNQDGSYNGIYAQRYAADGTPLGEEFRANTWTGNHQLYPAVAMASEGDFVITWADWEQTTGEYGGVHARLYDEHGQPVGGQFRVDTQATENAFALSVAMDGGGSFAIVWGGYGPQDSSSYGVYAQRYGADGTALGGELLINTYISSSQYYPAVAFGLQGDMLVAWQGSGPGEGGQAASGIFSRLFGGQRAEPDLVVVGLGVPPGANLGQTISVRADIRNHGAAAGEFQVQCYLSQDGLITAEDIPLGPAFVVGGLGEYETYALVQTFALPDATPGDWHVGVIVDGQGQVAEADEDNNVYGTADIGRSVNVAPLPLFGPERQVNTYTYGNQNEAAVGFDAEGNHVVVWTSQSQDGSDYGIYGQRFRADGTPIGTEFPVNTITAGSQSSPALAVAPDGSFVVAWIGPDASSNGIYARRYRADGSPAGYEFRVNTYTDNSQTSPSVAIASDGRFTVAWQSDAQDGYGYGVYAQRYAADGTAAGAEFRVNTYTSNNQSYPSVAMDADGDFVIAWNSEYQDGYSYGIYAQRYAVDGTAVGSEFRVGTHTSTSTYHRSPSVAMDSEGDFVIAWQGNNSDWSVIEIFAQRYAADGSPAGADFRVNTYTQGSQSSPAVAMDAEGDFAIAWMSDGQDGSSYGIYAQRYEADGSPAGAEFRVNIHTADYQYEPAVAMLDPDHILFAWTSNYQDGSNCGVFSQLTGISDVNSRPNVTAATPIAPARVLPGAITNVALSVWNGGLTVAPASVARLWLSDDDVLGNGNDIDLGIEVAVPQLFPDSATSPFLATIPYTWPDTDPFGTDGAYYFILEVDANDDVVEADEQDNVFASNACLVNLPNLLVEPFALPAGVAPGQSVTVSLTVKNTGYVPADASTLRLWLSDDPRMGNSDDYGPVVEVAVPVLAVWSYPDYAVFQTEVTFDWPAEDPFQTDALYYLIAQADAGGTSIEYNETDNLWSSSPIKLQAPDLSATSLLAASTVQAGQELKAHLEVRNLGFAAATGSRVRLWLSDDDVLDEADDVEAVWLDLPAIAAGGTWSGEVAISWPQTDPFGTDGEYYLLAELDSQGAVAEYNEANNVLASGPLVLVTPMDVDIQVAGHLGGASYAVAVAGDYAYELTSAGLRVLDVRDPERITKVFELIFPVENALGLSLEGDRLYEADDQHLRVFDLAVPHRPELILESELIHACNAGAVVFGQGVGYFAGQDRLSLVDLSDGDLLGQYSLRGEAMGVALEATTIYVSYQDPILGAAVEVVNVSDPAGPVFVSRRGFEGLQAGRVRVLGGLLAMAAAEPDMPEGLADRVVLLDVSNPASPRLRSQYDVSGAALDLALSPGVLEVLRLDLDMQAGRYYTCIEMVDVSQPEDPALVGACELGSILLGFPGTIHLQDGLAYVASGSLQVLDVSDPFSPSLLGAYAEPVGVTGLTLLGSLACASAGLVLEVFDASDPAAITPVGSYAASRPIGRIMAAGPRALLVQNLHSDWEDMQIEVVDLTDPSAPSLICVYDEALLVGGAESVLDVAASGDTLYVLVGSSENLADSGPAVLRALDISDPLHPQEVSRQELYVVPSQWSADGGLLQEALPQLLVAGQRLYVSQSFGQDAEPNDTPAAAVPLGDLGGPVVVRGGCRDTATQADVDWYRFTGAAGASVSAALRGAREEAANLPWGELALYDDQGVCLASAVYDSAAEQGDGTILNYSLPRDGDYYVRVSTRYVWWADLWPNYELALAADGPLPAPRPYVGISAYDLTDRNAPALLSTVDVGQPVVAMHAAGAMLYVSLARPGVVRAVDYSDPARPVALGSCQVDAAGRVVVNGTLLTVASGSTVQAVDVVDPSRPVALDSYALSCDVAGMDTNGLATYVAADGLYALSVRAGGVESADLAAAYLSVPLNAQLGSKLDVSWIVRNEGQIEAGPPWTDALYISRDALWDSGDWKVTAAHDQALAPLATYNGQLQVDLAEAIFDDLQAGYYYVILRADDLNEVDELLVEGNNTRVSTAPVYIGRPDLEPTALSVAAEANRGDLLEIAWTVRNVAEAPADDPAWVDKVYISPTQDPADAELVVPVQRTGGLAAGGQYVGQTTIDTALLTANDYYIIVEIDAGAAVDENGGEGNNLRVSDHTAHLRRPDLAVTAVSCPNEVNPGEMLAIAWTVRNISPAPAIDGAWTDKVYLTPTGDPADAELVLTLEHSGGLAGQTQYLASVAVDTALLQDTDYYVVVTTDCDNIVAEDALEANNTLLRDQAVHLRSPDLAVTNISVPLTVNLGDDLLVDWTVYNRSLAPAGAEPWVDKVYLSSDEVLDAGDMLILPSQQHTGGLDGRTVYHGSLSIGTGQGGQIQNASQYWVIVVTDAEDVISEDGPADNNVRVSAKPVLIGAPELTLDEPLEDTFEASHQAKYYRVTVQAGKHLFVALDDLDDIGHNELYIKYGSAPTRSNYDARYSANLAADQAIDLPSTRPGDYYILVFGEWTPDVPAGYTVVAAYREFEVLGLSPARGGTGGQVTITLDGANFPPEAVPVLVSPTGTDLPPSQVHFVREDRICATFDLMGAELGMYTVRVDGTVASAVAPQGFQVVEGSGPNLQISLDMPAALGYHINSTLWLVCQNTGTSDAPAPLVVVTAPETSPDRTVWSDDASLLSHGDPWRDPDPNWLKPSLQFLVSGPTTPGVIPPGTSVRIPIYWGGMTQPWDFSYASLYFTWHQAPDDDTLIDWDQIEPLVRPDDMDPARWAALWAQLQAQIGSTWGQYVDALRHDSTVMPLGQSAYTSVDTLFQLEVQKASASLDPSITGHVQLDGSTADLGGSTVWATDAEHDAAFCGTVLRDGSFCILDVPGGVYELRVEGFLCVGDSTIVVPDEGISAVELIVREGAFVTGKVTSAATRRPLAGATIEARGADNVALAAETDADGFYTIGPLPNGPYTVVARSGSLASAWREGVELEEGQLMEGIDFALLAGSTLAGSVELEAGGPAVEQYRVDVFDDQGHGSSCAASPGDGFSLRGLGAGEYGVRVHADGYADAVVELVSLGVGQVVSLGSLVLQWSGSVQGQVADAAAGVGLEAALVEFRAGEQSFYVAQTDSDGWFVAPDLAPGEYTVTATAAGHWDATSTITVAAGQTEELDLQLLAAGVVDGTVVDPDTGAGIAGVPVYIESTEGFCSVVTTAGSGQFAMGDLPRGHYVVSVGCQPAIATQYAELADGQSAAHLTLLMNLVGTISGTVFGPGGSAAMADVGIVLLRDGDPVATTITEDGGGYSFVILDPGTYDLRAMSSTEIFTRATGLVVSEGDQLASVDLFAGDLSVSGTVRQAGTSTPVANCDVVLLLNDGGRSDNCVAAVTDAEGAFQLSGLLPGAYRLRVLGEGVAGAVTDLIVPEGGLSGLDLEVDSSYRIVGTIENSEGAVVEGAYISVHDALTGHEAGLGVSDQDGHYVVSSLPPGAYSVRVLCDAGKVIEADVTVSGEDVTRNFTLAAPDTGMAGTVRSIDGTGLSDCTVQVYDASGRCVGIATTCDDGSYELRGLTSGTFDVEVSGEGFLPCRLADVSVAEGQMVAGIDAALRPAAVGVSAAPEAPSVDEQAGLSQSDAGGPFALAGQPVAPGLPGWLTRLLFNAGRDAEPPMAPSSPEGSCSEVLDALSRYRLSRGAMDRFYQEWRVAQSQLRWTVLREGALIAFRGLQIATDVLSLVFKFSKAASGLKLATEATGNAKLAKQLAALDLIEIGNCLRSIGESIGDIFNAFHGATLDSGAMLSKSTSLTGLIGDLLSRISTGKILKILDQWKRGDFGSHVPFTQLAQFRKVAKIAGTVSGIADVIIHTADAIKDVPVSVGLIVEAQRTCESTESGYHQWVEQAWEDWIAYLAAVQRCKDKDKPKPKPPIPPGGGGGGGGTPPVRPVDPNEKLAPAGHGQEGYLNGQQGLPYTVFFENDPDLGANAPAQVVRVTDDLDEDLDLSTFELTEFVFGDHVVAVPPGTNYYATTVDLRPGVNLLVEIEGGVDSGTRQAYWTFTSIDPDTGETPADVMVGFLPVNDDAGCGEGHVGYTIRAMEGLETGDEIWNYATIEFDVFEPIVTNNVLNTIDAGRPVSRVFDDLPALVPDAPFTVTWGGSDDDGGSGIATYTVYVREDDGPWETWLSDTAATSAEFVGVGGHSYAFRSVATDHVGYVEEDDGSDEAHTTVDFTQLRVDGFEVTPSGFVASFKRQLRPDVLNLYDTEAAAMGPADVTVVGATVGPVSGSIVYDDEQRTVTFIKTGGPLEPDTYTITLRSGAGAFQDLEGHLLDGDADDVEGGDFVRQIVVEDTTAPVLSLPDIVRGPGQDVDIPAAGSGIPITLSDGDGARGVDLVLRYDPPLLTITDISLGEGLPASWSVISNLSTPGRAIIGLYSPVPLGPGAAQLLKVHAQVPETATYSAGAALSFESVQVNEGAIAVTADAAMQVVAYLGDVTGNHTYSALDASDVARVAAGLDGGFAPYSSKDPSLVGDVTANQGVTSLDASDIARKAVDLPQDTIPDLPGVLPATFVDGPDPLMSVPNMGGRRGDTISVPIMLDDAAGLRGADVHFRYDTTVFDLAVGDVARGDLTDGWSLVPNVDDSTGEVAVVIYTTTPLAAGGGSILLLNFHIRDDAALGETVIDLLDSSLLNEGALTLTLQDGTVTVAPRNAAPEVQDHVFQVDEDEELADAVAGGDDDGDVLSFEVVSGPSHGQVDMLPDGTFTYQAEDDWSGQDSFSFRANDGQDDSPDAVVHITVLPVNDVPQAAGQAMPVGADGTVAILLTGTDVETAPDDLACTITTPPAHGTLTEIAPGVYRYQVDATYDGSDSFEFTVTDTGDPAGSHAAPGDLTSLPATVTVDGGQVVPFNANGIATFLDADGKPGTARVRRGGTGGLFLAEAGQPNIGRIILDDTTPKTTLTIITARGSSGVTVGGFTISGPMQAISARTTTLVGDLIVDGVLGALQLDDVAAGHRIDIAAEVTKPEDVGRTKLSITLDRLADTKIDTHYLPISSLSLNEWLAVDPGTGADEVVDSLSAPCIDRLYVHGRSKDAGASDGDFQADLDLHGANARGYALGSANVAGEIACTWTISGGDVGRIRAGSTAAPWTLDAGDRYVRQISTKGDLGGSLTAGYFGTISARGDLTADITATAYDPRYYTSVASLSARSVKDTVLDLAGGLKTLRVNEWIDGDADGDAGELRAGWAGGLTTRRSPRDKIDGDFHADVILTGANLPPRRGSVLGSASIAGEIACLWDIDGNAGRITASSTAETFVLDADGRVKGVSARDGLKGTLTAGYFDSIYTRAGLTAVITTHAFDATKLTAIGSLTAKSVTDTTIRAAGGGGLGRARIYEWIDGTDMDEEAGSLEVGWLGSLYTRRSGRDNIDGHFAADVTVTGQHTPPRKKAFGTAKFAGDLLGCIDVEGDLYRLWTGGGARGTAGDCISIRTTGDMHNVSLAFSEHADFLAGVQADCGRHAQDNEDFLLDAVSAIRSFTIRGVSGLADRFFLDSTLSAVSFGQVRLRNAEDPEQTVGECGIFVKDSPTNEEFRILEHRETTTGKKWVWPTRADQLYAGPVDFVHVL